MLDNSPANDRAGSGQSASATGIPAASSKSAVGAIAAVPTAFATCESCHAVEEGAAHGIGPNLHGVFGSVAGSKDGFEYSEAMASSGIIWDEANLDAYLQSPQEFMPGNRMAFLGEADAQTREEIIAFLKSLN